MKTGAFIRTKRGDKWVNLDVADMTEKEFTEFIKGRPVGNIENWAILLQRNLSSMYAACESMGIVFDDPEEE